MRTTLCILLSVLCSAVVAAQRPSAPTDLQNPESFSALGRGATVPPPADLPGAEMARTPRGAGAGQPGAPVPEPGTLLLVGTGLVGVALTARLGRRRRQRPA